MVQSLGREISDDVRILKLDVQEPFVNQLIWDYRAFLTPTFVVIGRNGEELWRQSGGVLDKDKALETLDTY